MGGINGVLLNYIYYYRGSSYVNTIHLIVHSDNLKKDERELAVNVLIIFIDFGILLASLFSLIIDFYLKF